MYSSNVTIANSWISTGDDNVALNGSTAAFNVTVRNNWFGDGHGASIGSYTTSSVSNVLFDGITIAGNAVNSSQNGARIKSDVSRGGLVQNITYRNICMKDVRNAIVLDPFYTAGATGNLVPRYQNIMLQNIHATTESRVTILGHDADAATTIQLDNVQVDGVRQSDVTAQWAAITIGPGPVNFASMLQGTGVTTTGTPGPSAPYACPATVFSPVGGELLPGSSQRTVLAQVFATKAVPYQTYLANLRTNPSATLELPKPTGTVIIYDGATQLEAASLSADGLTTVNLDPLPSGLHTLTASYSGDANYAPITFGSLTIGPVPTVPSTGVVNAASFAAGRLAQGSMFSLFGTNLGPVNGVQASDYPLPAALGDTSVRVSVGGRSFDAWMLYSSAGQINAILPSNTPVGEAQIAVMHAGQTSAAATVNIVASAPGIFFQRTAGIDIAIAQNVASVTDYPLNQPSVPAKPGQTVVLWLTGLGPAAADNVASGAAADMTTLPITISVGGVPAQRQYAGRQPQFAAVDNIYFTVPAGVPFGCRVPVAITVDGVAANLANIAVTADGSPCR
jgi:uncharacterized protein (TIGR03437 family)